uniref:Lipocalin n=1 Tax=Rhipicephalus zambeziensis TaxID=60191 RepID=A0A224YJX8_9ACAR
MRSALMRIATLALLLLLLDQASAAKKRWKCRNLKSMMTVDWKRLDKKLWVQSLITKPFKNTQCISRCYRGEQNKVRFRAIGGSFAQTWHVKREFQNGWHNKDKIGFKQGPQPHVYQILDTDYETFVVEHLCNHWRGDVVSIMYHKPVKQIPESVIKRANAAMIKSGLDATKMTSTDCMLSGKGISVKIEPWYKIEVANLNKETKG